MGWLFRTLNSSIGKKFVMALTGIFLILFLLVHLVGNLALFANDGGESFNAYAAFLKSFKIIYALEIGLALIFIYHIFNGIRLYFENRKAKPVRYAVDASSKNSSLFSRTMVQTGSVIFIFLVVHLRTFWFSHNFEHTGDTLYELVVKSFQDPLYSGFYIVAMIILGFHLNHGFQSAFQTFGWNHKKYTPLINSIGSIYSILMAVGFASMPVYFLFFHGGLR